MKRGCGGRPGNRVRFVLDENMNIAVVAVLLQREHEVVHIRDRLAPGAPDIEVADLVDRERAVLLTFDLDFRELLARRPASNRLRWRHAGRVLMTCNEKRAPERLTAALHIVEAEAAHVQDVLDRRVLVDVGGDVIRVER